jgi:hypothetical protein
MKAKGPMTIQNSSYDAANNVTIHIVYYKEPSGSQRGSAYMALMKSVKWRRLGPNKIYTITIVGHERYIFHSEDARAPHYVPPNVPQSDPSN